MRKLALGCTFCYGMAMQETTSLRERKKAETRTALSQAVLRLALERGLDAVTADDIAAAANVSVRTFHNYFGTKEEALVAAWRSEFQVYVDALRDRRADEPILVRSSTSSRASHRASGTVGTVSPPTPICSGRASRWRATALRSSTRASA